MSAKITVADEKFSAIGSSWYWVLVDGVLVLIKTRFNVLYEYLNNFDWIINWHIPISWIIHKSFQFSHTDEDWITGSLLLLLFIFNSFHLLSYEFREKWFHKFRWTMGDSRQKTEFILDKIVVNDEYEWSNDNCTDDPDSGVFRSVCYVLSFQIGCRIKSEGNLNCLVWDDQVKWLKSY